ncbi:MAG: SDR family NAD(P)-dependent oxidoreductase, partial [bacterium]
IKKMAKGVLDKFCAPDILVNNAGLIRHAPVVELSLDHWNEVITTNLTGVFLVTRAFLPAMIEKNRGDIFMISSMSGKKGDPGGSVYAASKFGLQGFSQALAHEVRRHNIRVMVLNPSSVDTGPDTGPKHGPGLYLHAADIADTLVHLACLPGRTLIRDMDIWGTNPFK